ncbi:MAG: hypothetical protein GY793_10275 [Proteobacteria bacterium]|nr:hypothetical protein [Pseudomonadota bacterium]
MEMEKSYGLTSGKIENIKEVANKLQIPWKWLKNLIAFETAGTFSPTVKNPRSSARGLIQFMDSTARGMGYKSSLDLVTKNPTFETQLKGPVYNYLKKFGSFISDADFYMSVFYPKYRKMDVRTVFPSHVLKVNPGITDILSYLNHVRKKAGLAIAENATLNTFGKKNLILIGSSIILAGVIGYYLIKK